MGLLIHFDDEGRQSTGSLIWSQQYKFKTKKELEDEKKKEKVCSGLAV